MARTDAEKREYARKYYQEYTKKGRKKGRKKGKKKAAKTSSLLGVSAAGLSPEGMIEAAAIKETLKKEMNAALAKAKTPEEQLAIRKEYSKKAMEQIQALKKNPKYAKVSTAKPKATKQKTSSGSKKSSGSGSLKSSESSSKRSSDVKSSEKSTPKASETPTLKNESTSSTLSQSSAEMDSTSATPTPEPTATNKTEQIQAINDHIQEISKTLASLTPEQKEVVKEKLNGILDNLKTKLKERLESLAG